MADRSIRQKLGDTLGVFASAFGGNENAYAQFKATQQAKAERQSSIDLAFLKAGYLPVAGGPGHLPPNPVIPPTNAALAAPPGVNASPSAFQVAGSANGNNPTTGNDPNNAFMQYLTQAQPPITYGGRTYQKAGFGGINDPIKMLDFLTKYKDFTGQKETEKQQAKIQGEVQKGQAEADSNFSKIANAFSGLISAHKALSAAQGGETGLGPGIKGYAKTTLKKPGAADIEAFDTTRNDTADALTRIITGTNRPAAFIFERLLKTLPDRLDPDTYVASKTRNAIVAAYRLKKGADAAGVSFDKLSTYKNAELNDLEKSVQLTPVEQNQIDGLVQSVLNTPGAKQLNYSSAPNGDDIVSRAKEILASRKKK